MTILWNLIGAVLLVIGGIWCGQGAGYIAGSFMTNDKTWLIIGIAFVCLGAALLIWTNFRKRPA